MRKTFHSTSTAGDITASLPSTHQLLPKMALDRFQTGQRETEREKDGGTEREGEGGRKGRGAGESMRPGKRERENEMERKGVEETVSGEHERGTA